MTFADIWNYTIPTQKQFRISNPEVYPQIAAFYAYNGEKKCTVEVQTVGFRCFMLFVTGQEPRVTDPLHIRQDMLELVSNSIR